MAFTVKDWKNAPDATTPISATALEDMEERVTDYADSINGGGIELGYAAITSNATVNFSIAAADIAGLSINVTVGSRPIVVKVSGNAISNDANNATFGIQIKEGSTTLAQQTRLETGDTVAARYPIHREVRLAPSPGSHTYKVTLIAITAGTTTLIASSDDPCFIQALEV